MVQNTFPVIGEHIAIIFMTRKVTIAIAWPVKNTQL